jgi:hypothetical protein
VAGKPKRKMEGRRKMEAKDREEKYSLDIKKDQF